MTKSKKQPQGRVYLVGAGPGDPALITLRGLQLIEQADVIVYDYLVSSTLLHHAPPAAELIYVGKKAGRHTLSQEKINERLIEKAHAAGCVVRLKGGDPCVFGRGGEEALALSRAGIPFEIVPGITAGVAAGAYAGIPVTHRDFASDVAFITGQEDADRSGSSQIDWPALGAWQGTLVFFMGVKNLPIICQNLRQHGMPPDTPAALIRWATTPSQQTLVGSLADLPDLAKKHKLTPPAVIVIGRVVTLREQLNWFERRPLFGRRIVITRSRPQASDLRRRLEQLGAEVLECPTIKIEPPEDELEIHNAIVELRNYDWIVFTSVNGVEAFFRALDDLGLDARRFAHTGLCAIGPATADRLRRYGLVADLVPPRFVAEAIVETLDARDPLEGLNILLPRADIAPPRLPQMLRDRGAAVKEITAYRTVIDDSPKDEVLEAFRRDRVDWITFTSSSTVTNFLAQFDQILLSKEKCRIASIGPVTSTTIKQANLKVDLQADPYTIPGLVDAILAAETTPGEPPEGPQ